MTLSLMICKFPVVGKNRPPGEFRALTLVMPSGISVNAVLLRAKNEGFPVPEHGRVFCDKDWVPVDKFAEIKIKKDALIALVEDPSTIGEYLHLDERTIEQQLHQWDGQPL